MGKNKVNNYPTVSVVIPFYSRADWLDEAVSSVVNQSTPPLEIIIVNDGSKEDISFIESKYGNLVKVFNQTNKGAASARNKGIEIAKGELIFFLDSDDLWDIYKIEKQRKYMVENGFVWSATYYFTFGQQEKKSIRQKEYSGLCWKKLYDTCNIQTSTVAVFKRELFKKNFDEEMKNGQDIYLWFKLSNNYPLGLIKEELSYFRIRGNNAHLSLSVHIRVRAQLWERMLNNELLQTNRPLTKIGYKICFGMYKKMKIKKSQTVGPFYKFVFFVCWLIFRLDELIQK